MDMPVHPTQLIASDDEDLELEQDGSELEGLEDEAPRALTRTRAFGGGGKRPRAPHVPYVPVFGDDLEQPDLSVYFAQWEMEDKHVILLCRSYASYLAARAHSSRR